MDDRSEADTDMRRLKKERWLKKEYERGNIVMSPTGPLSLSEAITIMRDYYLYEFSCGGKVFYVGHTYHHIRSHGRWRFVRKLLENERNGTLTPGDKRKLDIPNNRVIAALIEADLPEHLVSVCHPCGDKGRVAIEEMKRIQERLSGLEPCVLANDSDLPHGVKPATVEAVLKYLGIAPKAAANSRR
jgi:hypothetical protein